MFRQLARNSPNRGDVFLYHPLELVHYLETVWFMRNPVLLRAMPSLVRPQGFITPPTTTTTPIPPGPTRWHHLVYSYLIESTSIFEIFDRVLYECLNGERLGVLTPQSQRWLRNTEDLFYKDPPPYSIFAVKSDIRPDTNDMRRNAYYRMFGRKLPQDMDVDESYVKPEASNLEFTDTWEEFIRQCWVGIENFSNTSGANPTDDSGIADLARRLSNMLLDRRQFGTLSREEYIAVATMSWYHETVSDNHPIIVDLRAVGSSEEERLKKVGEKVSLPSHHKTDSYFQIAGAMSTILLTIETRFLNNPANAPVLYNPRSTLSNDIDTIANHWSKISGRNMKATK